MGIHYGPWEITITDGDTAITHEVYAATEQEAVTEAMTYSDFYVNGPEDEGKYPDFRVLARRVG